MKKTITITITILTIVAMILAIIPVYFILHYNEMNMNDATFFAILLVYIQCIYPFYFFIIGRVLAKYSDIKWVWYIPLIYTIPYIIACVAEFSEISIYECVMIIVCLSTSYIEMRLRLTIEEGKTNQEKETEKTASILRIALLSIAVIFSLLPTIFAGIMIMNSTFFSTFF